MQIVDMPIGELHPYENNPRINDDAVGYVANSISEFGFKVPVIIDRGGVSSQDTPASGPLRCWA